MKSVFVWNRANIEDFTYSENTKPIEEFFNDYFSPYKAIYSAKARHFIPLILEVHYLQKRMFGDSLVTLSEGLLIQSLVL